MSFPDVSDVATASIESRTGEIADSVTKNTALLMRLKKKGKIRTVSGGRLIYQELSFAANGNGGWYSGYDTLPVAAQDVISAAEFSYKQYAVPVTISGLEMLQNSGKEAVLDLLEARMGVAEATMANDISVGIYSDGTGSGGKTITGLDAALAVSPSTGTYGGIDRASWTFWRNQTKTVSTTATTIQANMNLLWVSCVRGNDKPDLIAAGNTTYTQYLASLQTLQRFTSASDGDLGFDSIKYMSADVVLDGGIGGAATATDMYFINTNYLHFRPHKDRNFVALSPKTRYAVNQDAQVAILGWAGNLTCSGAQFQGRAIFA